MTTERALLLEALDWATELEQTIKEAEKRQEELQDTIIGLRRQLNDVQRAVERKPRQDECNEDVQASPRRGHGCEKCPNCGHEFE